MQIQITAYTDRYIKEAVDIWNQVVEDGVAFPQMELLTEENGDPFFKEQSFTGLALDAETGQAAGLYILHPNNVGRCGHICNASYAVHRDMRGHQIGEALVRHCLQKAKELGFKILQFNAVVAENKAAIHTYEKFGFEIVGTIPGGFQVKDGRYVDMHIMYLDLTKTNL